jgi:protein TonB
MKDEPTNNLLSVFTLVLWTGCVAVGVAGMHLMYPRPRPPAAELAPVQATILQVEVRKETLAPPVRNQAAPVSSEIAPAVIPTPEPLPPIAKDESPPPMMALANLNPFIERVPVAPVSRSFVSAPATHPIASAPVVQTLTLGVGEGSQPMPEYPREAQIARQEGTVVVRFSVDGEGGVENVLASPPCPFPILNQAAVRAVRDTWRFAPGPPRLFEVSISFQLRRTN